MSRGNMTHSVSQKDDYRNARYANKTQTTGVIPQTPTAFLLL